MNFSDLKTYCKDPKNRNTVNVGLFIVLIISFHFLYLGWQAIDYWPVTRWVNDLMVWSVNLLYGQCCWVLEHVFRIDITTINAQRLIAAVNKEGGWIIRLIKRALTKVMARRNTEPSLCSFLMSLVSVLLTFFLILAIVGILGINTSSLVALLASAGLAIGMALSGTLQNFAGGVMIMLFKPFKVGDFIAAQGYEGFVNEIQIFNTHVLTTDNKEVILPNGILSTGVMTNFSKQGTRRVDWTFSFAYGDDFDAVGIDQALDLSHGSQGVRLRRVGIDGLVVKQGSGLT